MDVGGLSYADEIRLFARTKVLISLFGSSLHNVRYMHPETVVIEIRGSVAIALRDNFFYWAVSCKYGQLHAHYGVASAYPKPMPKGQNWHFEGRTARVCFLLPVIHDFTKFVGTVLPGDPETHVNWTSVHASFDRFLVDHPDPTFGRRWSRRPMGTSALALYQRASSVPMWSWLNLTTRRSSPPAWKDAAKAMVSEAINASATGRGPGLGVGR